MGDKLLIYVDCGDGAQMSINRPSIDGGISWRLRYSHAEECLLVAASVIESYDYLLSNEISTTEATRRLRVLRKARQDALQPPEAP